MSGGADEGGEGGDERVAVLFDGELRGQVDGVAAVVDDGVVAVQVGFDHYLEVGDRFTRREQRECRVTRRWWSHRSIIVRMGAPVSSTAVLHPVGPLPTVVCW